ncbi:MAG TPA: universal stress protein, partial [Acidimicrobiia bacterium]|nr:universal stress protein [Acidimicrobiia bacterium]
FERIVVGVSKADSAKEAARRAIELAQKFGAELHLVVAFEGTDTGPQSASRRHAEGMLESIALSYSGKTLTHALPDDPTAAILRVADEVDADLIVVGNKGMRGAARVLGSVPNSIAHKASCSVLIVSTT